MLSSLSRAVRRVSHPALAVGLCALYFALFAGHSVLGGRPGGAGWTLDSVADSIAAARAGHAAAGDYDDHAAHGAGSGGLSVAHIASDLGHFLLEALWPVVALSVLYPPEAVGQTASLVNLMPLTLIPFDVTAHACVYRLEAAYPDLDGFETVANVGGRAAAVRHLINQAVVMAVALGTILVVYRKLLARQPIVRGKKDN